jgi:ammonium transporter Rh
MNTVLALLTCCVFAVMTSRIVKGKIDMEVLLNSTLAGGVAIGSASDLVSPPWVALFIGALSGVISALGFLYLTEYLTKKIGLYDTCGIHNLHGMPGILGGVIGAIQVLNTDDEIADPTFDKSKGKQCAYQFYALLTTLAIAIASGLLAGKIAQMSYFSPPSSHFDDREHYHEAQEEEDDKPIHVKPVEIDPKVLASIQKEEEEKSEDGAEGKGEIMFVEPSAKKDLMMVTESQAQFDDMADASVGDEKA